MTEPLPVFYYQPDGEPMRIAATSNAEKAIALFETTPQHFDALGGLSGDVLANAAARCYPHEVLTAIDSAPNTWELFRTIDPNAPLPPERSRADSARRSTNRRRYRAGEPRDDKEPTARRPGAGRSFKRCGLDRA